MPARARIKRKVREAIGLCGGIDGAAATAERCRSVAGDWNNLNSDVFPPLDCALAMDEIAVALGRSPVIVAALARELGGVFVPGVDAIADEGTLTGGVMALAKELGDLAAAVNAGLADGDFSKDDAAEARAQLYDVMVVVAQMDRVLRKVEGE